MILQPVLMPVPGGDTLPAPQRVVEQRRVARRALAECARLCGIPERDWPQDDAGVPQPAGGYYWSISHKPLWAAAVIADRPVGIDIEHIKPRHPDLFDAIATPEEWALLGERSWEAFFRLWTAKEATLKANSRGISGLGVCPLERVIDASHLTISYEGQTWTIEHCRHGEHVAAVTAGTDGVAWHVVLNTAVG
jgi:phosphopantetheinyl transferase